MKEERKYGIDLLRIIATFMICILHVLGRGGILKNSTSLPNYYLSWLLEILCYGAVNIYAIISGYVGLNGKQKKSSIIYLWITVVFIDLLMALVSDLFLGYSLSLKDYLGCFIPILTNAHWYFTAYFILYLSMPILNVSINNLDRKYIRNVLIILCLLFGIVPLFFSNTVISINNGYSALWLILCYLIGAYIKKYDISLKFGKGFVSYLLLCIVSFFTIFIPSLITYQKIGLIKNYTQYIKYPFITIILSSIFIFLAFKDINIKESFKKIISFICPFTFGIYLVHTSKFIWVFLKNKFIFLASTNSFYMILMVLVYSLLLFIICMIIDYLRELLFKGIKLKNLLKKLD